MTPPMRAVRKFNPGTGQTDDEVTNQFVVRDNELVILLDVLHSNIDAACCQSTLVDNHTEYFRGHLEHLPRGERRVYVAIIDLWQPSGAGEIAQRARMDVRPASTCIGRLLARGLISAQGTGRRKRYVATERLYSTYYKLRRERDEAAIICNLIRFMMAFYTTDDLMGMSDAVATYDAVWHRYGDCGIPEVQVTLAGILFNRAVGLRKMDDHQVAIDAYEVLDHTFGDSPDPEIQCWVAQGLVNLGVALSQDADDSPRAIRTFDQVVDRFAATDEPRFRRQVATALLNRGVAQLRLGDHESAIATWDDVVDRFSSDPDEQTRVLAVSAMIRKAVPLTLPSLMANPTPRWTKSLRASPMSPASVASLVVP